MMRVLVCKESKRVVQTTLGGFHPVANDPYQIVKFMGPKRSLIVIFGRRSRVLTNSLKQEIKRVSSLVQLGN